MKPALTGRRLLVTVAAGTLLAAGGATTALAARDDGRDDRPPAAKVTAEQAAAAALKAAPGRVAELDLDDEDGRAVWEADVLASDGAWREVRIDGGDARVLANVKAAPGQDDDQGDENDGREDAAEAKALEGTRVTAAQAAATALKAAPGTVVSVDFERAGNGSSWDVEVAGRNGEEREVTVDAATGKVTANAADRDDDRNDTDGTADND
ncbi:PepSY domain-containing protein [Actinomadura kijaniata]|uniref:PepSY domain-containing protein n=1 Tax=Actinomadura kijaniata TaxID=46161 RepID=UPI000831825E|nr:PepSY domain-containing protein [Actinomadura kijaniata]